MDPVVVPIQPSAMVTTHHPASNMWQHALVVTQGVNPHRPFFMLLWLISLEANTDNNEDIVNDLDVFPFAMTDPNAPAA
eukprot:11844644-Ditylum_brightwellii.AAC.1